MCGKHCDKPERLAPTPLIFMFWYRLWEASHESKAHLFALGSPVALLLTLDSHLHAVFSLSVPCQSPLLNLHHLTDRY